MMQALDFARARFNRLRHLRFEECAWRAGVAARTTADRLRVRLRAPRWQRRDLARALDASVVDKEMRTAMARGDWLAVHDGLARRLRQGEARCALDANAAADVRKAVLSRWPSAAADAAARADTILDGRYDILGYRSVSFSSAPPHHRTGKPDVDWHLDPVHQRHAPRMYWADVPYLDPAIGDHKIIWELNRHQHWLQLGRASWLTRDPRYAAGMIDHLESWLAANAPLAGINWASMLEIGLRSISWAWALQFLLADVPRGPDQPSRSALRRSAGSDRESGPPSQHWPVGSQRDPTLAEGSTPPEHAEGSGSPVRGEPWLVDMLVAIDRQLTHVEQHLSYYFSPNTHLTGEALALYVVGHALPELAASDRWRTTGRRILLQEIGRQILADGGHAERSTHYQRYTLDFYLLALLTAQRAGDSEAIARFADAATRLAEFTRTMADDRGRLPLIGDDDGGMLWPIMGRECLDVRDSLAVAAIALARPDLAAWGVPEEVFWIAARAALDRAPRIEGSPTPLARPSSRTLADTGYVVARDAAGGHAVFDVGAHGYMNGGHAHADALSLTLSVANRPLLVDPGTSTYTMDARLRDRMRGSANHNTVTVDGQPQSVPAGPFHWRTSASARLHASRHNAGFDWAEGSHNGYGSTEHHRSVFRADGAGWLVVDEVVPAFAEASAREPASIMASADKAAVAERSARKGHRHSAAMHWHLDPGWMAKPDAPGRLRATHFEGDEAWLLHDAGELALVHGDDESGLGWYAPVYGTLIPTWTARVTHQGVTPFSMVTWIGGAAEAAHGVPSLARIVATPDPVGRAVAARVVTGSHASVFLLRPGEPRARESRACGVVNYQTNARALHFRTAGDCLLALDLIDGSHALALRDGWVSVEADEPVADLHAGLSGNVLDLSASEPPRRLRIQGTCIAQLRAVSLNGRPFPPPPADRPDTLLIPGGEWGARPLVHYGASFALGQHASSWV